MVAKCSISQAGSHDLHLPPHATTLTDPPHAAAVAASAVVDPPQEASPVSATVPPHEAAVEDDPNRRGGWMQQQSHTASQPHGARGDPPAPACPPATKARAGLRGISPGI